MPFRSAAVRNDSATFSKNPGAASLAAPGFFEKVAESFRTAADRNGMLASSYALGGQGSLTADDPRSGTSQRWFLPRRLDRQSLGRPVHGHGSAAPSVERRGPLR